jgi:hypothetical protein
VEKARGYQLTGRDYELGEGIVIVTIAQPLTVYIPVPEKGRGIGKGKNLPE